MTSLSRLQSILCMTLLFTVLYATPSFALVAGGCGTSCIQLSQINGPSTVSLQDLLPYLARQFLLILAFYVSAYYFGRLVQRQTLSPSLSRKLVCVLTFVVSFANSLSVPAYGVVVTVGLILFSCIVMVLMFASLTMFFRSRIPALKTVFTAINRPEDEPYTLAWLTTEAVVTSLVIILFIPIIGYVANRQVFDQTVLHSVILIPIFASGIGDALAEIVGKRWGKHHYKTYAVFGKRTYTRSLEGSFMVFLTTIIVALIVAAQFQFHLPLLFWKAFILLPITLTLAEAKAPHTWDNPILYLVGYISIIICLM